ncbi:DUF7345 domain-containing protein [Halorientalis marina]|uniref:DUF7345 domain-containing protein n=1 Tax=Halorientalis marina TaxID=2931976 RepID=UPI001FF3181A|nr:hypothetical protein [Halorientalis marina]
MELRRTVVPVVVALVLVASPAVGTVVGGAESGRASTGEDDRAVESVPVAQASVEPVSVQPDRLASTQTVDPDTVLLRADVAANGTAHWRIEYLVRLDDRNTTDAFESVAADIREDPTPFTDRFTDRMRRTVRAAENATGREMAVEAVTVETERQDLGAEYGVVRYEFTWTNFAAANETTLRIGDALGGFFLDGETQLTVAWPEGYNTVTVDPPADEQAATEVVWQGRRSFSAAGPRVAVSTTAPATATTDGPGGPDDGTAEDSSSFLLVGLAVVVVAVLGGAVVLARRRDEDESMPAAGAGSDGEDGSGDGDAAGDSPPEELLSNEERVLELLEERGGRIKQQEIAGELDWTDAKTSQVVTGLREDDAVEVFRLGRENVVSLPDEDDI